MKKNNAEKITSLEQTPKYKIESINITTEPLKSSDFNDGRVDLSSQDNEAYCNLFLELRNHPESVKPKSDYFKKIEALIPKYPKNPVLYNQLAAGYMQLGNIDKVQELTDLMYEKFPHYLFGKLAKANFYLIKGFPEKFLEVFEGKRTLQQLLPNREVYHIDELKGLEQSFFQYYCAKKEWNNAKLSFNVLKKILTYLDREEDPLLKYMEDILYIEDVLQSSTL